MRLSRAAVLVDKALAGRPPLAARFVDYEQRQRMIEAQARRELRGVRDALAEMTLD
jgi:hypothetical protein